MKLLYLASLLANNKKNAIIKYGGIKMEKKINELSEEEFSFLIKGIVKETMEEISEDILALTSHNYIRSIEEARKDYKEGKVKEF